MPALSTRAEHEAAISAAILAVTQAWADRLARDPRRMDWLGFERDLAKAIAGNFGALHAAAAKHVLDQQGFQIDTAASQRIDLSSYAWSESYANVLASQIARGTRQRAEDAARRETSQAALAIYLMLLMGSTDYGSAARSFDDEAMRRQPGGEAAAPQTSTWRFDPGAGGERGAILDAQGNPIESPQQTIGGQRADSIAKTESTRAITSGESGGATFYRQATGIVLTAIWRHPPQRGPNHPCPKCRALEGQPRERWAAINPDAANGPPLHPNCDCFLDWVPTAGGPSEN